MLATLEKSERFQKEYKMFKEKIEQIDHIPVRKNLTELLGKLVMEVRSLDSQHNSVFERKYQPSMTDDSRNKIAELRKKISKTLEDWERAKK